MPIRAVAYVSEAGPAVAGDPFGLGSGKLDDLVDDAARFNRSAGVTGVLLFDGSRFLQYME
ncbi:MAG: BLUF domain-containing protein, partial [Lysobacteraceae bacterium]